MVTDQPLPRNFLNTLRHQIVGHKRAQNDLDWTDRANCCGRQWLTLPTKRVLLPKCLEAGAVASQIEGQRT